MNGAQLHLFAFFSFLFLQRTLCSVITFPHKITTRRLTPSRRTLPVFSREISFRRYINPSDSVILDYSHQSLDAPKASIMLAAHPGVALILLEDMDHLVASVSCDLKTENDPSNTPGSNIYGIEIELLSSDIYQEVLRSWSAFAELRLITFHSSCNDSNERGAWRILGISGMSNRGTLILIAERIPMRQVGKSFKIRFGQSSIANHWQSQQRSLLSRRDVSFNPAGNFSNSDAELFPANLATILALDSGSLRGKTGSFVQALEDASVIVNCGDCFSRTNFTVDMDFEVSGLNITNATIMLTVEKFEQSVQLQISMNKSLSTMPSFDLLNIPIDGWEISDIIKVGPSIGISIDFDFEMAGAVNFTIGANGSIPQGASASVNFADTSTTQTNGWDGATANTIPFRLNGGEFNMSAGISLSPFIELGVTIAGNLGISARISQNAPFVFVNSSTALSVNRDCNPIGDNDFESFATAYMLNSGMKLRTLGSLDLATGIDIPMGLDEWNATLWEHELPFLESTTLSCFIIANDASDSISASALEKRDTLLSSLMPAPTGTLVPAASAVPTFDLEKIESYYSAQGHLPTNVNYKQLIQATTVPDSIKAAVQGVVKNSAVGMTIRGMYLGYFFPAQYCAIISAQAVISVVLWLS